METTIIGIDCATDDSKVGLALAVSRPTGCAMQFAGACSRETVVAEEVISWLSSAARALIAFDAPLGWPRSLGKALAVHRAGEPITAPADDLFRRTTDRYVKSRFGKQSLDVGADRIARTAHSALKLLADLRQRTGLSIPMAWEPAFSERVAAIEVYPAATLIAHDIPNSGYKKKTQIAERTAIMSRLERAMQLPLDRAEMVSNADALDAAVCVLAGSDFLRGNGCEPEDKELARHEGWIWVGARPTQVT